MSLDNDFYKMLFEQSPDAIVVIDPGTLLPVGFNDRILELLGYTREEFTAVRIADCEAVETGAASEAGLAGILGCGSGDCDTLFRSVSGVLKSVRVIAHTMDLSGQRYFQLVIREISRRKRAEGQLRAHEKMYADIFDHIGLGVTLLNPDMRIQSMNPTIRRWFPDIDVDQHPVCYESFNSPPAQQICSYCPAILALSDGLPHLSETETPTPDGIRHYRMIATPVFAEDGRISAIIETAEDITERKQAEDAHRQSDLLVRNVIDSLDDCLVVIDDRYRVIMANKAYRDHFSVQPGDIMGRNCFEIVCGFTRPCFEEGVDCPVSRTFENGQPAVTIRNSRNVRYGDRIFEIKSFPLKDTSGKITAVIEVSSDITCKLKLEDHERNSQKLGSLGILAGGIAHDFNNLLAAIQGNISLAKMRNQPDVKLHELLTRSEDACEHAAQLSRQLLTFAKGGALVRISMQIADLVRNSVGFALSGSNVLAEFSFPEHLPSLTIDDGQMRQVFCNLAINAKEAMPNGGRLSITAETAVLPELNPFALPAGPYVKIVFRDQGGGIPNDVIGRVFDPYFSTKEMGNRKGQGLGLTICHSIVTKHGGAITVGSVPGEGAAFFLFLPLSDTVNDPEPSAVLRQTTESTGVRRILVMDDEECLQILLVDILESIGHRAVAVNNGRSAIESYRAAQAEGDPFAVVILDLTIAGEAGAVDTIMELRQVDAAVKAIITSGYATDHVMTSYREYGFMGAVAKPYALESLKRALEEVFSG